MECGKRGHSWTESCGARGLDKLRQFSGALGLRHLDVPNMRGRKDHEREQERSGSDHETQLDEQFDFGSAKEAEGDPWKSPRADMRAPAKG